MQLKLEVENNTLIVYINGELDHHSAEDVREDIDTAIDSKNIKNIVFELSNMKFMDSSGIGVVIGRYKKISKLGGRVGVVNTNAHVDRIFQMAGIYKIIDKYSTKEKALENM
ncbi:anti-sigma F factor antagonist [Paramaledivibacter caminithermalis]|uniref:Anti-sigma F factor antagonist n=1 Tax=Paramaledivibacter caminithermalis (strain DSM 15212 / CIP 107654 / DViRD3) TaxID=1121301 RepID=A0A1M6Q1L8_PARC5|nr:anti-sigma F factor antagonist [Paramaledivibacter caminithermalis]SHK14135.1 anti-anti-sigma regulatory factor, SpoIIAA [Paramaledivibacter caminithermalis DSM 15212]